MKNAYHSALSDDLKGIQEIEGVKFPDGSIAFAHDIVNDEPILPLDYEKCDVLYSELAWISGYEKFNKRAGRKSSFDGYVKSINEIIYSRLVPVIIVIGKSMLKYFSEPTQQIHTKLNGYPSIACVYNAEYDVQPETTEDLLEYLATQYKVIGDFCCGYGLSGKIFIKHGKKFVMSDHNKKCIGYIHINAKEWYENLS